MEGKSRLHARVCAHGAFLVQTRRFQSWASGELLALAPVTERALCIFVWQQMVRLPSLDLSLRAALLFLEHRSRTTRFLMLSLAEAFGELVVAARWVRLVSQGPGLRVGTQALHKGLACCPGQENMKAWLFVLLSCEVGLLLLLP